LLFRVVLACEGTRIANEGLEEGSLKWSEIIEVAIQKEVERKKGDEREELRL